MKRKRALQGGDADKPHQSPPLKMVSGLRIRKNLQGQVIMSCCANASGHLRLSSDIWIHENSISSSRRYLLYYKTAKGKQKPLKNVENVSRFFPSQLILHLSHCLLVEAELNIHAVPGETWAKGWPKQWPPSPCFMEHLLLGCQLAFRPWALPVNLHLGYMSMGDRSCLLPVCA